MKTFLAGFWLLSGMMIFWGCSEATNPGENPNLGPISQFPGCQGSGLPRVSASDSCFDFSFRGDSLDLRFCITGNCCPDSNRFQCETAIHSDTITIGVSDIEENLCLCMCLYHVGGTLTGLSKDAYTVNVRFRRGSVFKTIYSETITKP